MARKTLSLPEMPETAIVKEARELANSQDPDLIAWTMALIHARDVWYNTRRKGR